MRIPTHETCLWLNRVCMMCNWLLYRSIIYLSLLSMIVYSYIPIAHYCTLELHTWAITI